MKHSALMKHRALFVMHSTNINEWVIVIMIIIRIIVIFIITLNYHYTFLPLIIHDWKFRNNVFCFFFFFFNCIYSIKYFVQYIGIKVVTISFKKFSY